MNDLKEIAKEIKTQDNMSTADPIFILFEQQKIPTANDYSDNFFYNDSPNDCYEIGETLEELIDYARETIEIPAWFEGAYDWKKEDYILSKTDICKVYYIKVKEFKQAFFTKKSAEQYLESNNYHFNDPLIWCSSLWRNGEMQAVRNALLVDKFQLR